MRIITFFAAVFAAALAGMGVGGGGLFVVYLTLVLSVDQLSAQGINLWFFVVTAVCSLAVHIKKRKINTPLVLYLSLCGTAGCITGSLLAPKSPDSLLRGVFGFLLIAAGMLTLFKKPSN